MKLSEVKNTKGEVKKIISKGDVSNTFTKITESAEIKSFLRMVQKDTAVLEILCNQKSNLSITDLFNYPLLIRIQNGVDTKIEDIFELGAARASSKAENIIQSIISDAKEALEDVMNLYQVYSEVNKLQPEHNLATNADNQEQRFIDKIQEIIKGLDLKREIFNINESVEDDKERIYDSLDRDRKI